MQCLQSFVKRVFVEEAGVWYRYKEQALTRARCFIDLLARVPQLFACPAPEGQKSVAIAIKQSQFFRSKGQGIISFLLKLPGPALGELHPTQPSFRETSS